MGRRTNRYCVDCGARLVYYARLSNPKARNEDRKLVYGCMDCTNDSEKPKLLAISTNSVDDPIETVEVMVVKSK